MIASISEDEFRLFRELIHRECGLYFGDNKRTYLCSRIGKRLAATSIGSFYRYYRYLTDGGVDNEQELLRLLDVLTILSRECSRSFVYTAVTRRVCSGAGCSPGEGRS